MCGLCGLSVCTCWVLEHIVGWREALFSLGSLPIPGEPPALCHGAALGPQPALSLQGPRIPFWLYNHNRMHLWRVVSVDVTGTHQDCPGGDLALSLLPMRPLLPSPLLCWIQNVPAEPTLATDCARELSLCPLAGSDGEVSCAIVFIFLWGRADLLCCGSNSTPWLHRCLCLRFLWYQGPEMRYFLSTCHSLGRRCPCHCSIHLISFCPQS